MRRILTVIMIGLLCFSMFTILSLKVTIEAFAEPSSIQWDRTYGGLGTDRAYSLVQTNDDGYALAGFTKSYGSGLEDAWLVKTDSSGNKQWDKTYGGSNNDEAWMVIQTSDGGYGLAGYTLSFGAGLADAWLVKTDSSGTAQWTRWYGGPENDYAYSVVQTSDGGYALAGSTSSVGAGSGDAWLVKTDSSGNMLWNKAYGGSQWDYAFSLIQTNDGGYALAGSTMSFGAGNWDAYLIKTDSMGNMLWSKTYGGSGSDEGATVVQTGDGGYALVCNTKSYGAGGSDFYLVTTDSNGNTMWTQTYGGANDDFAYSLIQTTDGGYAVAGRTFSYGVGMCDYYLIKTDSSGNILRDGTYGGSSYDDARSVVQTGDGGYTLAGDTFSYGAGDYDFWLVKVDLSGELFSLPAKPYVGTGLLVDDRAFLTSVSPSQTITASPGQTISLAVGYQIWQGPNPTELDQLLLIYSWTPSWPPSSDCYAGIYDGMPPSYPGDSGTRQIDITVPSTSGTYYIWFGFCAHYSIPQAAATFTAPLPTPAHIKIVVEPSQAFVLHVQSSPTSGVSISYTGDYSGTGTTNFDVGPKDSPFTVTLTAPVAYENSKFVYWMLDGAFTIRGLSNSLSVTVDDQKPVRVATAVYKELGYDVKLLLAAGDIESGGILHAYFQVCKTEADGSETPTNNVAIESETALGSQIDSSVNYLGMNGIVHLSYDLSSYTGDSFSIRIQKTLYDGLPVYPPAVNPTVFRLSSRRSTLQFGTTMSCGAACLGQGAKGDYTQSFSLISDGSDIFEAGFYEGAKMGYEQDYHLLKTEVGAIGTKVGGCAGVGIFSSRNYALPDLVSENEQKDIQRQILTWLITKWILTNARTWAPSASILIDAAKILTDYELSKNGVEDYRLLTTIGAYGESSLGADVFVGLSSEKASAKNTMGKIFYAGAGGSIETDVGVNFYSSGKVGFTGEFSCSFGGEASLGLDMGFLSVNRGFGGSTSVKIGVELIYEGIQLSEVELTFSIDVSAGVSGGVSFGGLATPLNEASNEGELGVNGRLTLVLSVPAGRLASGLLEYISSLAKGEIQFDEMLTKIHNTIVNTPVEYEIRLATGIQVIPINIELKLAGTGVKIGWNYDETHEYILEKGVLLNWHNWPIVQYRSLPSPMNTLQFIRDHYIPSFSGMVVQLKENAKHLYLHVYDAQGRHVGINHETNHIEMQILGSYYYDDLNGTIAVVLPLNLTDFRLTVDGRYAQEALENYNLTTTVLSAEQANYTQVSASITKGERQEYKVVVLATGLPSMTLGAIPFYQEPMVLSAIGLVVAASVIISVVIMRRSRRNRMRGDQAGSNEKRLLVK